MVRRWATAPSTEAASGLWRMGCPRPLITRSLAQSRRISWPASMAPTVVAEKKSCSQARRER